jgi:hypothetical protein
MDRNGAVQAEEPVQVEDATTVQSFSTWGAQAEDESIELPGPGSSWNAGPPRDTAVPVSDEMIETLVGGFPAESPEVGAPPDEIEEPLAADDLNDKVADELRASFGQPSSTNVRSTSGAQPNIDHLLQIARDLEYGLMELAETVPAESAATPSTSAVDATGLDGVLANLQSDDDLKALRDAVETARDRPRDVDVMLDLVLRADAIAMVIEERDRLKAAIEAATGGTASGEVADETTVESSDNPDDSDESDLDIGDSTDDESEAESHAST